MYKRIIILEDEAESATMLKKILLDIDMDNKVYISCNVENAYKYALENSIDLFLVDIVLDENNLNDTSGIVFTENIRKIDKYKFTPVIFITGLKDPMMYVYKNLHIYSYIEKPYDCADVKNILAEAMDYKMAVSEMKNLYFRKKGVLYAVEVDKVVYMESHNRVLNVYMIEEKLQLPYITCSQILDQVNSKELLQCSRNVIVNKDYIRSIDVANRYITLVDGYGNIEIGTTFKKKVANEFEGCVISDKMHIVEDYAE